MTSRVVITAEDVQAAAQDGVLHVPAGAIVTPLARDVARDLSVTLSAAAEATAPTTARGATAPELGRREQPREGDADDDLSGRVRNIVMTLLAGGGAQQALSSTPASGSRHPVKLARRDKARLEPFPHPGPPPGMQVETVDVVTAEDGAPMAAGYMTLTQGSFPWEFSYDEVQIVLEGELHLGTPDGVRIGRPGDILYVPKGSSITFGTPSWTKFIYVTFPADWEAGL